MAESEGGSWPFHLLRSCVFSTEELNASSSGSAPSQDQLQSSQMSDCHTQGSRAGQQEKNGLKSGLHRRNR